MENMKAKKQCKHNKSNEKQESNNKLLVFLATCAKLFSMIQTYIEREGQWYLVMFSDRVAAWDFDYVEKKKGKILFIGTADIGLFARVCKNLYEHGRADCK